MITIKVGELILAETVGWGSENIEEGRGIFGC